MASERSVLYEFLSICDYRKQSRVPAFELEKFVDIESVSFSWMEEEREGEKFPEWL